MFILLHGVSFIAVVQKRILIRGEAKFFYLLLFLFYFSFRDQQRAALKFEKLASENIMHTVGFSCKRDG